MMFRPLEISISKIQLGFTICSFGFLDESYYSFLGLIYDYEKPDEKLIYISLFFFGLVIELGDIA